MIKTLIVEDENLSAETLKNYLLEYCSSDLEIIGIAQTVKESTELIRKEKPDLVFLDVLLADGTGFDILNKVKNTVFRVIFTTGYDQFALEAFQFHAAHYLLKPLNVDDLTESVEMVIKEIQEDHDSQNLKALLAHSLQQTGELNELYIRHQKGFEVLKTDDIIYCRADGSCTFFHMEGNKKVISSKPLGHYEDLLKDRDFVRVHHSYLVNRKHITGYSNEGVIALTGNISVPLGDTYRKKFLQQFRNG
jgi:two-component system, LytTR family, response regulator